MFNPVILHPNVFPSGKVSLSLIDKNKGWKPQVTTKEVQSNHVNTDTEGIMKTVHVNRVSVLSEYTWMM